MENINLKKLIIMKLLKYFINIQNPWSILKGILKPQTIDILIPLALSLDIQLDDLYIFLIKQITIEYL